MVKAFEWMLAFRYLRARNGFVSVIATFSLLGIALGVAALIVVMSVMNGFRTELLGRILGISGHISIHGNYGAIYDYDKYVTEIRGLDGVKSVMPVVEGQVMVSANGAAQGAMVNGIRAEDISLKPLLADHIVKGDLQLFKDGEGVMIGSRMAHKLGLGIGDSITLISPEGRATIAGMMPRIKPYPIVATFDVGMFEYDSGLVIMPFEEAQVFFKLTRGEETAVSGIEVMLNDVNTAETIARDIGKQYSKDLQSLPWQYTNQQFFNALEVERNVMFLILTLLIVIAAFNIICCLIMLVREKRKAIAILRTVGASRGSMLRVFIICGFSIGLAGTALGVLLGLSFALNIESIRQFLQSLTGTQLFAAEIYFLSKLPAEVSWSQVYKVISLSLGLSFAATLYPSWKAARSDPAEALRDE